MAAYQGHEIRLHGFVQAGSIEHTRDEHRFVLSYGGVNLRVRISGPLPDTFRDLAEIVVTGRIETDDDGWSIIASTMLTRCATKYDARSTLDIEFK
jgi:cytochrome c-type biogenesis protein CcmE